MDRTAADPATHRFTLREARRIAVRAQLLDAPRPTDLLALLRRLTLLQVDFTAAVAHSHDLVCWSRLGRRFAPAHLTALRDSGRLVELDGLLRPAEDIALYRADMAAWPGRGELKPWQRDVRDWLEANAEARRDVLEALRADGPLASAALPDTCAVPWRSSGWNDGRNVRRLLAVLERRGEVAVATREGRDPLWDLAERVYDDLTVPAEEAEQTRDRRRLTALGIARPRAPKTPGEPNDVGAAGEPAVVEGVRGQWRVDPGQLGRRFHGRTVLLSPLDRLVYDRTRLAELFGFDYQLEMYKPVARRRFGYWTLPILHGDRFAGRLDATADRDAGELRVDAVHREPGFETGMNPTLDRAVEREIAGLASWLGLRVRRS